MLVITRYLLKNYFIPGKKSTKMKLKMKRVSSRQSCFLLSISFLLVMSSCDTSQALRSFGCPSRSLVKPCTCIDKHKGLDISCEGKRQRCDVFYHKSTLPVIPEKGMQKVQSMGRKKEMRTEIELFTKMEFSFFSLPKTVK